MQGLCALLLVLLFCSGAATAENTLKVRVTDFPPQLLLGFGGSLEGGQCGACNEHYRASRLPSSFFRPALGAWIEFHADWDVALHDEPEQDPGAL